MKGMISMMKLPLDVRQDFVDRTGQDLPKACARALADIEGNLGEAFAACDDEALFIYSKKLNEEWRQLVMPFNTIAHMALEDDRPFVYLKAKTSDGNELSLKFGSMDEDVLCPFCSWPYPIEVGMKWSVWNAGINGCLKSRTP